MSVSRLDKKSLINGNAKKSFPSSKASENFFNIRSLAERLLLNLIHLLLSTTVEVRQFEPVELLYKLSTHLNYVYFPP